MRWYSESPARHADGRRANAAMAYLYSTAAGIVGAALRLIPLGQLQGQLIIRKLTPLIALAGR